jgi:hypothetical protein
MLRPFRIEESDGTQRGEQGSLSKRGVREDRKAPPKLRPSSPGGSRSPLWFSSAQTRDCTPSPAAYEYLIGPAALSWVWVFFLKDQQTLNLLDTSKNTLKYIGVFRISLQGQALRKPGRT